MKKVSIIVPVYKVENELDRCVQSLIGQTYQNIEIILVDDGSPDRCPQLCEEYARKDPRIRVIHKENGGLSDARNAGLCQATGDYVLYVDSDDYIDADSCERFIEATLDEDIDIVVGNAIMEKSAGVEMMTHAATPSGKVYSAKEFVQKAIKAHEWYAPACFNMYRKEFLIEHSLFFKKGVYFEDMQMLPRVFLAATRITCMEGIFYHYVVRDNSIMTSQRNNKKVEDAFQNLREWKDSFDRVDDAELRRYLYGMLLRCYLHECRVYKITDRRIPAIDLKFAIKYGLGVEGKIKAIVRCLAPRIYVKL